MNDFSQLLSALPRPPLYAPSDGEFWADPHISKGMLAAHLNPDLDAASRTGEFIARSAGWIASQLPVGDYPRMVDLGCGPGLYASLFSKEGYRVTGIDLSPRSLRWAREQAEKEGLSIDYIEGSYLQGELPPCDAALLIYCDYGALSPVDRRVLLKKVYGALRPGGVLLLDVFTPLRHVGKEESHSFEYLSAGGFWSPQPHLWLHSFFPYGDGVVLRRTVVVTESGLRRYHIWDQDFTPESFTAELTDGGFSSVTLFGDAAGAPLSSDSPTLCALVVK